MTFQTTDCPGDALLRGYLDDDGDPEIAAHITACPGCRERIAEMRADAAVAASLLARLEPENDEVDEVNVSAALSAWRRRNAAPGPAEEGIDWMSILNRRGARVATAIGGVFALLMVLTISPMGSFAGDLLDRFRVQRFAAITIEMDDFQGFQTDMMLRLMTADVENLEGSVMNLADYTTTFNEDDPFANVQEFASAEEAGVAYGGDFQTTDDVPDGYSSTPAYYVSQPGSVTVNVNTAEAQAIVDELNLNITALPAASAQPIMTFTLEVPKAIVQDFQGATEDEHLVIAQLPSPVLNTPEGLDMDLLRRQLLQLPGLPPDFVAQLNEIEDWQSTLVIPVPEGHSSQDVTINGEPGLLITSDDGAGAVALWESDGVLFIVGGTESGDTISDVANSLD